MDLFNNYVTLKLFVCEISSCEYFMFNLVSASSANVLRQLTHNLYRLTYSAD